MSINWKRKATRPLLGGATVGPEGNVYFADLAGWLYAYNADGDSLWKFSYYLESEGRHKNYKMKAAPTVNAAGTVVYITSEDWWVYAVHATGANAGTHLWRQQTENAVTAAAVLGVYDENAATVMVGGLDEHAYGFEAATGKPLWSIQVGGEISHAVCPTASGRFVYLSSRDGYVYAVDTGIETTTPTTTDTTTTTPTTTPTTTTTATTTVTSTPTSTTSTTATTTPTTTPTTFTTTSTEPAFSII